MIERRVGAACGAMYVVVLVVAGSLGEPQPALSLELLSLTLFLPFAAILSSVLSGRGPRSWLSSTVLAAAIVDTSVKLASIGSGYSALDLPKGPLRQALTEATDASFIITMTPLALLCAAAGFSILRTPVLPRWLGWTGLVTAAALLANGTAIGTADAPAYLLFLLWTLGLSLGLLVSPSARRASQPTEPAGA